MTEFTHDDPAQPIPLWKVTGSLVRQYTENDEVVAVTEPRVYVVGNGSPADIERWLAAAVHPDTFTVERLDHLFSGIAEITATASAQITEPSSATVPAS